ICRKLSFPHPCRDRLSTLLKSARLTVCDIRSAPYGIPALRRGHAEKCQERIHVRAPIGDRKLEAFHLPEWELSSPVRPCRRFAKLATARFRFVILTLQVEPEMRRAPELLL